MIKSCIRRILASAIVVFAILDSSVLSALETRFRPVAGGSEFQILIEENGVWLVDRFELRPNSMQQKIESIPFIREVDARAYWRKSAEGWRTGGLQSFISAQSLMTTEAPEKLWEVREQWSRDWENAYFDWVAQNFNADFFAQYNIATDCADAAIYLRWIFARIHGLPMGNRLAGTEVLFTQDSMRKEWLSLPTAKEWNQDRRFLKALEYLTDSTYTHTLFADSYPIRMSVDSIRTGNFLLQLHGSTGHTRIIAKTIYDNSGQLPITLISSTIPKDIRSLYTEPFLGITPPIEGESGLRAMKWLVGGPGNWSLQEDVAGINYGLDQYQEPYDQASDFAIAVYEQLNLKFDPRLLVIEALGDLTRYVDARIQIVKDGFAFCQINDCSPGTENWEDWSTPSRDERMVEKIFSFLSLTDRVRTIEGMPEWIDEEYGKIRWDIEGKQFSLNEIQYLFFSGGYSFDPRASIKARWGIESEVSP